MQINLKFLSIRISIVRKSLINNWIVTGHLAPGAFKIRFKVWDRQVGSIQDLLLETILCKFGRICATGNAFVRLVVGRNSILNFPAKI